MREIKFRAWDRGKEKIYEVNTLGLPGATFTHSGEKYIVTNYEGVEHVSTTHLLQKFALMQYTGLRDKNGKEIYEGDIICTIWKHVLETEPNLPELKECPPVGPKSFHWYAELEDMEVEVFGNIYENPELLS